MKRPKPRPKADGVEPGELAVDARPWAHGTVLTLRGELDLDTADILRDALDEALRPVGTVVVIDFGALEFCDSTGLNVLLRARARADADGCRIELTRPRPLVLRMLELTGAAGTFPIRDAAP
ncbi:STAS domain-containing protein [Kitasatospora sp. NPDC048239]|uniref:STAS domain-containing protein n=1 Tax=Kitasatospora sp. NPDC048239 TaxID=3364046 RepID=UPI0037158657